MCMSFAIFSEVVISTFLTFINFIIIIFIVTVIHVIIVISITVAITNLMYYDHCYSHLPSS